VIQDKLTKRINFLIGKNGCGKSSLLRALEQTLARTPDWFVKYITPERGGPLTYDANIEQLPSSAATSPSSQRFPPVSWYLRSFIRNRVWLQGRFRIQQFFNSGNECSAFRLPNYPSDSIFISCQLYFRSPIKRVQHDRNSRQKLVNFSRCAKSVQARHGVIQNYQIGTQLYCLGDCFTSIYGLATNLPARVGSEQRPNSSQYQIVVIGN